jgi:hypothetical protein
MDKNGIIRRQQFIQFRRHDDASTVRGGVRIMVAEPEIPLSLSLSLPVLSVNISDRQLATKKSTFRKLPTKVAPRHTGY